MKEKKFSKKNKDPVEEALDMIIAYEKDLPPRKIEEEM